MVKLVDEAQLSITQACQLGFWHLIETIALDLNKTTRTLIQATQQV